MGALSDISGINRVIAKHDDAIRQEYAAMVPESIRDRLQGVSLMNNIHALEIAWLFN